MLRQALLWIGALLVLVGLALLLLAGAPGGLAAAGFGAFLLIALAIERHGYKKIEDAPPGPDWLPTGELFREPGSDVPVAVYYHPRSGKRAYVRQRDG